MESDLQHQMGDSGGSDCHYDRAGEDGGAQLIGDLISDEMSFEDPSL